MMMMELHNKAKALAKTYKTSEQELLGVLMEMQEKNLFLALGYKHLFHYVCDGLELGESQASYFNRVAQKARVVPELKTAVLTGEISLSQARRIVPVITPETAPLWIENAKTLKQHELEREVTKVNPKALTKEKVTPLSPERTKLEVAVGRKTEAGIKQSQDLLSKKLGRAATLEETLDAMADCFLERHDPVKKAERASSRKAQKFVNLTGEKIPAASLQAVNLRLNGQCGHVDAKGKRCPDRRWLHVHHMTPRSQGGTHDPNNLTLLCSAHHRMHHLVERASLPGTAESAGPPQH